MKVIIQRVKRASVTVDSQVVSSIGQGMVVLLGIKQGDTEQSCDYIIKKILSMRIFPEGIRSMEKSLIDYKGGILIVSQFTLYGDCANGNRPSFSRAMGYRQAEALYKVFLQKISSLYPHVHSGVFGAEMDVELVNHGPVTLELEY
jgi:D-tyrosyl-tRNA(Tyr) deacylase